MTRPARKLGLLLATALTMSACAIHHVTPYVPDASLAVQTAGAAEASANCAEASTAAETAICATPSVVAANKAMILALQSQIRTASLFGRDALLASQRSWLLALPTICPGNAPACLQTALADRRTMLTVWHAPASPAGGAIAQYVSFHPPPGAGAQPDPAFCAGFAQRADIALQQTGRIDPAAMGYQEVAGTHGPAQAGPIAVDLYDANVYALFQRRARSISLGGPPVLTPNSLSQMVEARDTANQGGRFSAFASQTGDYGILDVFRDNARLLAFAADPWGSTTPAAPGEAAHLGVWDLSGGRPAPVCLFDLYTRPAEPGLLGALPPFAAWREALAQIRDSAELPLGTAWKRDQAQLAADTDFVILHMPLLAVQEARIWSPWLRARHDSVLDALFAWSAKTPANKALFDRAFSLLRPAATELVRAYQTTQGLSAPEATQAGGVTVMELLYEATITIAPAIGSDPTVGAGTKPRYPILAAPAG